MNGKDHRKPQRRGRNPQTISMVLKEDEEDFGDDLFADQKVAK